MTADAFTAPARILSTTGGTAYNSLGEVTSVYAVSLMSDGHDFQTKVDTGTGEVTLYRRTVNEELFCGWERVDSIPEEVAAKHRWMVEPYRVTMGC